MKEELLYDDKTLLTKIASGSDAAAAASFQVIFDRYRKRIYSTAMHLTRSETMSEDIVQEVFSKVWEKRSSLNEINYFNTWLRTVTKNACIDALRTLTVERLALGRIGERQAQREREAEEVTVSNELLDKEYKRMLDKALDSLSAQQRKIWQLSREEGLTYEQIGKLMGIEAMTVKSYMKTALRKIKTELDLEIGLVVMVAMALYF